MSLNNLKNKKILRKFATDMIANLTKNPIIKYTEKEIAEKNYPDAKCVYCGQFGCDRKYKSFYIHNECFNYCEIETKKFMAKELGLRVKK